MSARELLSRLAHDVGKYVSRTARNLPQGDVPEVLRGMLLKDLYAIDGERRASAVFEEHAARLERLTPDPRIPRCRDLLREIDGLEPGIRGGDGAALHRAAELALEVDSLLRGLTRDLGEGAR
jgi:hypothetical protein